MSSLASLILRFLSPIAFVSAAAVSSATEVSIRGEDFLIDGRLTYESFNHKPTADEHDNGEIWSATLWDIWQTVGRDTADRIIVESHFQLDGFTTFARGARSILDADRNLFNGRHVTRLKNVFHKRGIGPVE